MLVSKAIAISPSKTFATAALVSGDIGRAEHLHKCWIHIADMHFLQSQKGIKAIVIHTLLAMFKQRHGVSEMRRAGPFARAFQPRNRYLTRRGFM